MTNYISQAGAGEYKIQFETDNKAHYELVQRVIRDCIDGVSVPQICIDVRQITDAEIEELRKMANGQCEYHNPLRMATTCRQRKLGEHNHAVLDALVNLKKVIEAI